MNDPRIERYATLLLDTCLDVRPGSQILVWGYPHARPLIEEVTRQIAQRGAYALLRLTFGGGLVYHRDWLRHAPLERIAEPASIDVHALEHCDGLVAIFAPDNTRDGHDVAAERISTAQAAYRPASKRLDDSEVPWVTCWYPTPAVAQDAGMTTPEFADFLYGACLLDWEAEHARISRHAALFEGADEVRIVGAGTDLTMSLTGRPIGVDAGTGNMPGGEFYACPVETSAEGTVAFTEFPALWHGREVRGIRLRFAGGRVVDASADSEEEFLLQVLDTDDGAPRPRRAGDRLQPGHHPLHAQRVLRREDRRHGPPGDRRRVRRHGRHEQVGHPLGHRQGPAARRPRRGRRPDRAGERALAAVTRLSARAPLG